MIASLFASICSLLLATPSFAIRVHGRLELGGLAATERFKESSFGSDKNDEMVASFRSYLAIHDIGSSRLSFQSDIRDKYDFFDKLNRERLQLDANNSLQIREFNVRQPIFTDQGFGYTVGRFAVPEAGSAFADGAQLNGKFFGSLHVGGFGGLNPKLAGQTYLTYNPNSQVVGTYVTYQPTNTGWDRSFYLSHAYVTQSADGQVDRTYLFQNFSYQWQQNSRLITNVFVDFVPRTYLQQGSALWHQAISDSFLTKLSLLAVDVIEYAHIQDVRERLPSSPYKQASLKLDYKSDPLTTWEIGYLAGRREVDALSKSEITFSAANQRTFGPNWETQATIGSRDNFTSRDLFARAALGYYSRSWEWNLNAETGIETPKDGSQARHPLIGELAVSNLWSRELYLTGSVQSASDEQVQILTAFFKVGYRFGNREVPPLRDGAPKPGPLQ